MNQAAMDYLTADPLQNAPLLSALRRGTGVVLSASAGGVLLWDRRGEIHMLSAAHRAAAKALLGELETCRVMMLCQHQLADIPAKKYRLQIGSPCRQVVYTGSPLPLDRQLDIRIATERELDRISATYDLADRAELEDLAQRGDLFCGFAGDRFVGYVGRHQEGSVGLLQVFPEYRRQGYGQQLEGFMVNRVLAQGEVPYGQVFVDNQRSLRLQEKLGWQFAEQWICWLFPQGD